MKKLEYILFFLRIFFCSSVLNITLLKPVLLIPPARTLVLTWLEYLMLNFFRINYSYNIIKI